MSNLKKNQPNKSSRSKNAVIHMKNLLNSLSSSMDTVKVSFSETVQWEKIMMNAASETKR